MDFLHTRMKIVKRSAGRSAIASAAYRSGTKLENTWDGVVHDYTRKNHVVHSEIMLPAHAPPAYADRSTLWNSVEWIETDRNSQLAREFEFSLPAELTHEQHLQLVRGFVQKHFVDEGMCADFSIHDKRDGNPHVHILLTMRAIREDGTWAPKSRLVYDLDQNSNRIPAKQKGRWKNHKEDYVDWNNRENGAKWRAGVAEAINTALHEAGIEGLDVDPRTYAEQGISRIPTIHEGAAVRAMERKGIRTDVGNQNRAIRSWNKQADQMEARLAKLNGWARYQAAEEKVLHDQGIATADPVLRHRLFEAVFNTTVAQNKKVKHLKDSMGMRNIMHDYDIQDATSFLAACKQVDTEFYQLRHDLKETDQLIDLLDDRIQTMETYSEYKALYRQYQALPERKKAAFYEANRAPLAHFEAAERKLQQWKDSGEELSKRKWQKCRKYLSQKRFVLEYTMKGKKDTIRYLEMVKHAFIEDKKRGRENERTTPARHKNNEQAI